MGHYIIYNIYMGRYTYMGHYNLPTLLPTLSPTLSPTLLLLPTILPTLLPYSVGPQGGSTG